MYSYVRCPRCNSYLSMRYRTLTTYWICPVCGYTPTFTTTTSTQILPKYKQTTVYTSHT